MSTLRTLAAAALLACASSSHALYANVTPPTGFSFAGGALRYGGTPAATMNWVSGASGISTSTSFIGRNFTVPGTARLAPGAGQAIARAMLSNPAMRLAPMLTWAAAALWVYDIATGQWTMPTGEPPPQYLWYYDDQAVNFGTAFAACQRVMVLNPDPTFTMTHAVVAGDGLSADCRGTQVFMGETIENMGRGVVWRMNNPAYGQPGDMRPVTQADADALAEAHPLPDAVAEAADDVMPLPVALPELQPLVQPIGQPRETPEGTVQDRVRITPANDEEAPWRVEETVETVPEGTDEETEGEEKPIDPCDEHPERVGCQTLEAPDDPGITPTTHTIAYEAENLGFGSGCPAPRTFTFHGWALPLDYTPVCNVAPTIRMGLIAITALGCILIIIGVTRS